MSASVLSFLERTAAEHSPQIQSFREECERVAGQSLHSPTALHAWSVTHYRDFLRTFLGASVTLSRIVLCANRLND